MTIYTTPPETLITNQSGTAIVTPPAIPLHSTDIEWIRKDVADALIAAAYVDAANLHQSLWRETSAYKTDQILKRTPTDARQALDALLKAERERALREASECVAEMHHQIYNDIPPRELTDLEVCDEIKRDILALISENTTDG